MKLVPLVCALMIAAGSSPVAWAAEEPAREACSVSQGTRIGRGHQDLAVYGSAGSVRTGVFDDSTGTKETRDSGTFIIDVADSLKKSIPGGDGLPTEGWVLPQSQDYSVPWVGFSTTELDASLLGSGPAVLTMREVRGPGRLVAFQPGDLGGGTRTIFDSEDTSRTWDLPARTHAHTGFIFTEPGAYLVTFTYNVPGEGTHDLEVAFLVGDNTKPEELCTLAPPSQGASGSGVKGIAEEIKKLDKELVALGTNLDKSGLLPTPTSKPSPAPSAAPASAPEPAPAPAPAPVSGPAPAAAPAPRPPAASSGSSSPRQNAGVLAQPADNGGTALGNGNTSTAAESPVLEQPSHIANLGAAPQRIEATGTGDSMVSFWAGVLAGAGGLAFIIGMALLTFVQLTRPVKKFSESE